MSHVLAFIAGCVFGALAPPLLLWALFRHDRRAVQRQEAADANGQ